MDSWLVLCKRRNNTKPVLKGILSKISICTIVKHNPPLFITTTRNMCSSPRKENNSKPPTGENVVPCERKIKVNPNRGKQGGIPKKESPGIANPKGNPSGRRTELVPRCPRENSCKDPSWRQKELIPRHQKKQRGIPEKESLGIFIPK